MKKQSKWVLTIGCVGLALVLVATSGCHRGRKQIKTDMTSQTGTGPSAGGAAGSAQPDINPANLPGEWVPIENVNSIYFDYDRSNLRADAMATLKKNADAIKSLPPGTLVRIAGNCDERGTQEYNLALGEKRALAARDYLIQLGVPASQIITISYGEENPVDPGHDEAAWAKNRRDDFQRGAGKAAQ